MAVDETASTNSGSGTVTFSADIVEALRAISQAFDTHPMPVDGDTPWEGILAIAGAPTSDKRFLMPDELGQRDLPLPLMVQTATSEGHDGAEVAGRIESIVHIPVKDFAFSDEFNVGDVPDTAVVVWATGVFDGSTAALDAERLIANGAGVSIDIPTDRLALIDPDSFEEVDPETVDLADVLQGKYLTGIGGKIAGATIVTIPAFEEASVRLTEDEAVVASAAMIRVSTSEMVDQTLVAAGSLTAAAAPLKPPAEWFENPNLSGLTPLTITKEGRIYGHLADWDGCHTGFSAVCVPPFRSQSDYAYFNLAPIETAEGTLIKIGKLTFDRDGAQHAPTDPWVTAEDASKHYDDATKDAGYVVAGADRFGTWLAGTLVPGLSEEDVQFIRAHPPSGDWRPSPKWAGSELIAAFCVSVPGFPIAQSLVASAGEHGLTIITGPLQVEVGPHERIRKTAMLKERLHLALCASGIRDFELESEEFADITSEQRKRWAKSGVALPDGSFPIVTCTGNGPSAENARRAIGRAPEAKRGRVRAHIAKRERALGCSTE